MNTYGQFSHRFRLLARERCTLIRVFRIVNTERCAGFVQLNDMFRLIHGADAGDGRSRRFAGNATLGEDLPGRVRVGGGTIAA